MPIDTHFQYCLQVIGYKSYILYALYVELLRHYIFLS